MMLHSFFDFTDPRIRSLLLVQVIGFPLAFTVRALRHGIKAAHLAGDDRKRSWLLTAASLCFALTSIAFYFSEAAGAVFLAAGIIYNVQAFRLARKIAESEVTAPPTSLMRTKVRRGSVATRSSKLRSA